MTDPTEDVRRTIGKVYNRAFEMDRLKAGNLELVEALELVMEWIENWNPDFEDDEEWVEKSEPKIRAAIARAKT